MNETNSSNPGSNNNDQVIRVENLVRRYRRIMALDDVSLTVHRGRVFGLVGENGAGKTTLIQHLLGRLKPQSGSVSVFNMDPVSRPTEVLARIGYVSEDRDIPEWMTIGQMLGFLEPFYETWDPTLVSELSKMFELDLKARVSTLSRGQKARANLLAALGHRPQLLLLDEPSSGLDVMVRRDILTAVIRTVVNEGRTVLLSSHLLDEVERVADDIAIVNHGKLVLSDSLSELTGRHHRLTFSLDEASEQPPGIDGILHWTGSDREWVGVCNGTYDQVRQQAHDKNIRIVEESKASLDDIFVAHSKHHSAVSKGSQV